MLGREWIMPNEWVDVQLGVVIAPRTLQGESNGSVTENEIVTVHLADRSNETVDALAFNSNQISCGRLASLGNGTFENIQ